MLFFTKKLTDESKIQSTDFAQYYDRFNFIGHIHKDKIKDIKKIKSKNKYLLPDIAASVIAQLQKSGYLSSKKIAQKGLYCCQDIMSSRGYDLSNLRIIYDTHINKDDEYFILVAGCQSRRLQRSRVGAAVSLTCKIPCKFNVIFSGKNPGTDTVKTHNEAVEMERIFHTKIEKNKHKFNILTTATIELDEIAHDTKANVKEFLNKKIDINKTSETIFVVSSTFHLLRISEALEEFIPISPLKDKIKKIILIGAENPEFPPDTSVIPQYLKWMFFDIYEFLFRNSNKFP